MKKTMLILAAVGITATANARILRVSNVSGSSAPYATLDAAHDAANSGDTIMVDASNTAYFLGQLTLTKTLVLIGPGYNLMENNIIQEGAETAILQGLHLKGEGSVIKGFTISHLYIEASKVVVNRCSTGSINISKGADNCIIHQNYITGGLQASKTSFHQITNNIFGSTLTGGGLFSDFEDCYVAYNTFRTSLVRIESANSTYEHNIYQSVMDNSKGNSYTDNYETNIINTQVTKDFIDKDYYAIELSNDVKNTYGAFAGDSPYVLAGVPSGPVIQDLIVPTTVEMGSKMNVTIKIGMSK